MQMNGDVKSRIAGLKQTAEALKEYSVPYVFPCHCTGDATMDFLAKKLGASVQPGYAGLKVSF
jgi:metal-dependent hydrolase (beta-lactamase superfamily II)